MPVEEAAWYDCREIVSTTYQGLIGQIRFEDGFWRDVPLNHYRYIDGALAQAAG